MPGPPQSLFGRLALLSLATILPLACNPNDTARQRPALSLEQMLAGRPYPVERPFCAIHAEFRPTIGCTNQRLLGRKKIPWPAAGRTEVEFALPELAHGRPALLQPRLRSEGMSAILHAAPVRIPAGARTVTIPVSTEGLKRAANLTVTLRGQPLYREREHTTIELTVPQRAHLSVGLGAEQLGQQSGVGPVHFRIALQSATAGKDASLAPETIVLDELASADALATGWLDRQVDLGAWAGQSVRLHFRTEVMHESSEMLPIWGAPQINVPDARPADPDILLISLDTLRADLIDLELGGKPVMPFVRGLADAGVRYTNATTTFSSTAASHMSLLTGVHLSVHGVDFPTRRMAETIPTLAQTLAALGWETAAVTENGMIAATSGFARGFRTYEENRLNDSHFIDRNGLTDTLNMARRWFEENGNDRFFFFLHTYEVHKPFVPPAQFDIHGDLELDEIPVPISGGRREKFLRYAAEAASTDAQLRQFFSFLRERGLLENTLVLILSDHGEGFGNGIIGHSGRMADAVMRIPLIAWNPALLGEPRRIETPISLVDLTPTLLDFLGLDAPEITNGHSFAATLRGGAETAGDLPAVRFGEAPLGKGTQTIVARSATRKWEMAPHEGGEILVYDLLRDPLERAPETLAPGDPEAEALRRQFLAETAAARRALAGDEPGAADSDAAAGSEQELDQATTDRLRALGYVE